MNRLFYIAVFAVALLAGGGWKLMQGTSQGDAAAEFALPGAAMAQTASDTATEEAPAVEVVEMELGNPDAPVTVIEYASYTCPHCATFHQGAYTQLKTDYIDTGKIRFVYREVYFDKYGMWASMIARCAGTTETFFGITDMVYKTQGTWARAGSDAAIADELRKIGRLAGLEAGQLEACLTDGDKLRALVEWFRANATEDGIDSTPSFVINGTRHANMPYDELKALIEAQM